MLEIIANGENSGIEFKRDDVRREQQQRLFESGGMLHVEVLPVMGTSLENIDTDRLNYYLRSISKAPPLYTNALARITAKEAFDNKAFSSITIFQPGNRGDNE